VSRFVEDPTFAAELGAEPQMKKHLLRVAGDVTDLAGALAAEDSGHYRRSLKTDWVQAGQARAYTDDVAGHLIEFGGANNVAQAPLRRAADAICDGFQAAPK
jgi:protein gp37